jgi:hypothetical protein
VRSLFTAVIALAGFAVFMVAFTLVPIIVIALACLVLFTTPLSRRTPAQPSEPAPAPAVDGAGGPSR